MSGKYEKKKEKPTPMAGGGKKGSKPLTIALTVVLALILIVVIAIVIIYNYSMSKVNKVDVPKVKYTTSSEPEATETIPVEAETGDATEEGTVEPTEPHVASRDDYINFLIIGQDAREEEQNHLADTMIVCTLNTYEKSLTLTSILRDTQLQVSGSYTDTKGKYHTYGKVKVNMIYASGYSYAYGTADAMGWMNQALYDNFGLEIDHDFEVDFEAFVKAIDILGGIDIDMSQAEADWMNYDGKVLQEISVGVNHLNGNSALAYARMRKAQGDEGDISRTERQRKVISAVLNQLKTLDLSTVQKLIDEVLPCISTSMSSSEITAMIAQMLPMLKDLTITSSGTCPMKGTYKSAQVDLFGNGVVHEVLTFNPTQVKKYMRAVTLGEGTIE